MAYTELKKFTMTSSPSFLCNNLDVLETEDEETNEEVLVYAVVHKAEVELTRVFPNVRGKVLNHKVASRGDDTDEPAIITQAKWCSIGSSRVVLVVTTYAGFQIFNHSGETLLLNFKMDPHSVPGPDGNFCRGIANHGNNIFIGTSSGTVLVLSDVKTSGELCSSFLSPVCDITCNQGGYIAVSNEEGLITLWRPNHQESAVIGKRGLPCTSVAMDSHTVVAGYSSGHARLFSIHDGSLLVEVAAHGQAITAIALHLLSGKLLTVSDDCTMALWQLPKGSDTQVTHLHCYNHINKQLCGARMLDENRFAVTAYDWSEIVTYVRMY